MGIPPSKRNLLCATHADDGGDCHECDAWADGGEFIVQIMPAAPGWRACYLREDGTIEETPLVGWGLTKWGDVVALDSDTDGNALPPTVIGDNFLGVLSPGQLASSIHEAIIEHVRERVAWAKKEREEKQRELEQ